MSTSGVAAVLAVLLLVAGTSLVLRSVVLVASGRTGRARYDALLTAALGLTCCLGGQALLR
ncbi:hypothetical protein KLP28_16850 [Nocardioidaceae bacterium]|nr:hypothetical protein KLP28_16850 [Nocardioidaceae bacterium]